MLIGVVGGKLQGVEATYLACKAGWKVRLIDRRPDVPARGLCDEFLAVDVCDARAGAFRGVDLILPALEDPAALKSLVDHAKRSGRPLAFDPAAYEISSSKIASGRLFAELSIPMPRPWPGCWFPVIAKPSSGSGSRGVKVVQNKHQLDVLFPQKRFLDGWVLQEFLEGPSFSIEVIGCPGNHQAIQVTDLFVDGRLDCMRVEVPTGLPAEQVREFEQLALRLANRLQLRGLMDVEVILNDGILKILEIDARLPSQTPTAVYWSTGYNLVVALGEVFIDRRACPMTHRPGRSVVYEHVHAQAGRLIWGGEHLMAAAGRLHRQAGFFGADEALTDYDSNQMEWRATLIFSADHRDAVWAKRRQWIDTIQRCLGLKPEFDSSSRERGQDSHDPVMCR